MAELLECRLCGSVRFDAIKNDGPWWRVECENQHLLSGVDAGGPGVRLPLTLVAAPRPRVSTIATNQALH